MSWELIPEGSEPGSRPGARPAKNFPWAVPLIVGIAVAALGLALLIWPFFAASRILAILIGSALIGNGLAALVGSRARGIGIFAAALFILLGVIAIANPEVTVNLLVGFVAATMLFVGVLWLAIALRMRASVHWIFIAVPVVVVALGIVALIWPGLALVFAAFVAGLITTLIGGSLVWAAFALRRRTA